MENCTHRLILSQTFDFWDILSANEKHILCDSIVLRNYAKGDNIHGGVNECTGAIVVKSGLLRAYILSENGRDVTLYRLYPGDMCMLSASCVIQSIAFDVFVDADVDSTVYIVPPNALKQISDRNLKVENYFLSTAVSRMSDVMWNMQQILFMSFDRRLASFLWDEYIKNEGKTINLTHEKIAKYLGSAREVVTRMLKYFSNEGIVELSRGGINVTDKEKLRSLCSDH